MQIETPHFRGVFIKHLSAFDIAEIDIKYNLFFERAVRENILTEKEKLKYLHDEGLWTKKDEDEINYLEKSLSTLEKSKARAAIRTEIKMFGEKIKETKVKITTLKKQREEFLGITAESYTNNKISNYYLLISLYKENLMDRFFNEGEFDDLEETQVTILAEKYNEKIKHYTPVNLKKITISNFFMNSFILVDNDPYKFYGKPVINLTLYQIELFNYGKHFKHILSELQGDIPKEALDNPDELEDYFQGAQGTKEMVEKNSGDDKAGGISLVGAKPEDVERMVNNSDGISLSKELEKHGGSMNFQQIIALHGGS